MSEFFLTVSTWTEEEDHLTHTQTRCLSLAHRVINILTHEDTAQQDRLSQQAPTSIGLVLV